MLLGVCGRLLAAAATLTAGDDKDAEEVTTIDAGVGGTRGDTMTAIGDGVVCSKWGG